MKKFQIYNINLYNISVCVKRTRSGSLLFFFSEGIFITKLFLKKSIYVYLAKNNSLLCLTTKVCSMAYFLTVYQRVNNILEDIISSFSITVLFNGFGMRLLSETGDGFFFDLAKSHSVFFPKKKNINFATHLNGSAELTVVGLNRLSVLNYTIKFCALKPRNVYTGKGLGFLLPFNVKKRKKKD